MKPSTWAIVVSALATAHITAAQPPPSPTVPADIAAALEAHVGRWRSEATLVTNGVSQQGSATWECVRAVGGIGLICTWLHEWPGGFTDRAVDLVGYDPASGMLSFSRVTDRGIATVGPVAVVDNKLVRKWEGTQDGKPLVGLNEVFMTPGGDWTQSIAVDVDGKRVTEMTITHHRER